MKKTKTEKPYTQLTFFLPNFSFVSILLSETLCVYVCMYYLNLKSKFLNKLYLFCGANYLKEWVFFFYNLNMLIYCFLNGNLQMCYWRWGAMNVHCILKLNEFGAFKVQRRNRNISVALWPTFFFFTIDFLSV